MTTNSKATVTDYRYCAEAQYCSLEGSKTASALPSYISYFLLPVSVACTHFCLFLRLPYVYILSDFHRFTIKSLTQFLTLQSLQLLHLIRR